MSQPLAVTFGLEGQILISDGIANAVLEFDRTGTFVRAFGRAGEGPGEFRLAAGALVTSGILVVVDVMALEFEVFDYHSGEPLGALPIRPQLALSTLTAARDSIWIAGIDRASWMAMGTVSPAEIEALVRSGSKNQHALHLDRVSVPEPYRASHVMYGALGHAFLDIGDSDVVIAFAGMQFTGERIYVSALAADGSWQCADTLVPPTGVGMPRTVLTGNHLLVVDQVPTAGDVATILRWFEVDASACSSSGGR